MDFFEHQDLARKKTARLIGLFVAAVIGVVAAVYVAVVVFVLAIGAYRGPRSGGAELDWKRVFLDWRLLATVAPVTLAVIAGGTFYRVASLARGGQVVALGLGGRQILPETTDLQERKLLNVVEEMAIASGLPVPPVYVLDEEKGINAFAAGHSPSDAVIGVTRGCMELLSRDELQGVIAHEFSHILNGDMRLNLRLMGAIFGITSIGLIGYGILRLAGDILRGGGAGYSRRRSGRGRGGAPHIVLALLLLGLALMGIGYIGTLFGHLIRAAVSRQREFLADASAVQFTRNPDGIAGALKKIGGYVWRARVNHPQASEAAHMFFGQAIERGLASLFATHPPLVERIRRIDPSFDGRFPQVQPAGAAVTRGMEAALQPQASLPLDGVGLGVITLSPTPAGAGGSRAAERAVDLSAALAVIGQPTPEHVTYARQLLENIPQRLRAAAREPWEAQALIFAMLLSRQESMRRRQMALLDRRAESALVLCVRQLADLSDQLDEAARLPLIDLALPALAQLSLAQYRAFQDLLEALIRADERIDLFEWVLQKVLHRHLAGRFVQLRPGRVQYYSLSPLTGACAQVLATLAWAGHLEAEAAWRAFEGGWAVLQLPKVKMPDRDQCTLMALDQALDRLRLVALPLRRTFLRACTTTIACDRKVTVREAEMFRALANVLDCPVPPLLPGRIGKTAPAETRGS